MPKLTVAPTPDEFAKRLEMTRFVGKGDHEIVRRMCKRGRHSSTMAFAPPDA